LGRRRLCRPTAWLGSQSTEPKPAEDGNRQANRRPAEKNHPPGFGRPHLEGTSPMTSPPSPLRHGEGWPESRGATIGSLRNPPVRLPSPFGRGWG
jgi:hypothetical protein